LKLSNATSQRVPHPPIGSSTKSPCSRFNYWLATKAIEGRKAVYVRSLSSETWESPIGFWLQENDKK